MKKMETHILLKKEYNKMTHYMTLFLMSLEKTHFIAIQEECKPSITYSG